MQEIPKSRPPKIVCLTPGLQPEAATTLKINYPKYLFKMNKCKERGYTHG